MNSNKWDTIFEIGKYILIVCGIFFLIVGLDERISAPRDEMVEEQKEIYREVYENLEYAYDQAEKLVEIVESLEGNKKIYNKLEDPAYSIYINLEEALSALEDMPFELGDYYDQVQ